VKAVAEALGVSRSNLVDRLTGSGKPRRRYHKAQDAAVLPLVQSLVDARPIYGYRRITALVNRALAEQGWRPPMRVSGLLCMSDPVHAPVNRPGSAGG
jgi:putative transposase